MSQHVARRVNEPALAILIRCQGYNGSGQGLDFVKDCSTSAVWCWDSLGCNGWNDTAITGEPSQLARLDYPIVRQHDQRIGIRADVDHHENPALVVELFIDPGEQLAKRPSGSSSQSQAHSPC